MCKNGNQAAVDAVLLPVDRRQAAEGHFTYPSRRLTPREGADPHNTHRRPTDSKGKHKGEHDAAVSIGNRSSSVELSIVGLTASKLRSDRSAPEWLVVMHRNNEETVCCKAGLLKSTGLCPNGLLAMRPSGKSIVTDSRREGAPRPTAWPLRNLGLHRWVGLQRTLPPLSRCCAVLIGPDRRC